jgi:putative NADH-flavin reductase
MFIFLPSNARIAVCSEGTKIIVDVVKETCPKARILTVTSMGVGDSINKVGMFVWILAKTMLASVLPDKTIQENYIKDQSSWLDWVIVRPGGLSNGESTGKYQLGEELKGGQIARADVAHFLVNNLKGDEWKHRAPSQHY